MALSDDLDARLERALIGGREQRTLVVVDYDPQWPVRFAAERERIAGALGPTATRVDHIGSTAVPGLAAKPIVDILVTVTDPENEDAYVPALERAGYELRVREGGHRMLRTPARDVHVHVVPAGGAEERRYLLLRDHLRASPADRDAYAALKRTLAEREWPTMDHYAEAKAPLIEEILERARQANSA